MNTRPPLRLKNDPDVGAALRRDLAAVPRSADLSVGYDVTAGLARFEASVGAAADPSGSNVGKSDVASAKLSAPAAANTGTLLGFKGMLITGVSVLAIGAAIIGSSVAGRSGQGWSNDAPAVSLSVATSVSAAAPAAPVPSASNVTEPEPVTSAAAAALQPAVPRATSKPRTPTVASSPSTNATNLSVPATTKSIQADKPSAGDESANSLAPPTNAMAQEMEHLARLRALARRQPAEALRVADEGDKQFPKGIFAQERQSIAIQSLVRLHRVSEAKQRARVFEVAYPRSPFIERMKSLLEDGDE